MKNLLAVFCFIFSSSLALAVPDPSGHLNLRAAEGYLNQYRDRPEVHAILMNLPADSTARDGETWGGATPFQTSKTIEINLVRPSHFSGDAVYVGSLQLFLIGPDDSHLQLVHAYFQPVVGPGGASVGNQ